MNNENQVYQDLQQHKEWLKSLEQEVPDNYQTEHSHKIVDQNFDSFANIEQNKKNKWDELYELNKIQQETRDIVREAQQMKISREEMECTFQPKICESSLKMAEKYGQLDFHKRGEFWQRQKNKRIKRIYESKHDKELLHCTFQPKILHSEQKLKEDVSNVKQKSGVDKFLERQKLAREEKKRKQEILNGKKFKATNSVKKMGRSYKKNYQNDFSNKLQRINGKTFNEAVMSLHKILQGIEIQLDQQLFYISIIKIILIFFNLYSFLIAFINSNFK